MEKQNWQLAVPWFASMKNLSDTKYYEFSILPQYSGGARAMHDKCIYFRGEDIYGDAKGAEVTNVSKRSMFVKLQYLYTSAS